MKKILIAVLLFLQALSFASCTQKIQTTSDTAFALDTVVQIKIYSYNNDSHQAAIDSAFDLITDLESILSVHIEDSELDKIKQNAGIAPVSVRNITYSIIEDSVYYSQITDGLFDITSGPLIDLWAIDPPDGYVPTDEELKEVLDLVDYNRINLLDNQVFLQDEGMIINLGAIAKGAIADEVKQHLLDQGVESSYINLGGNIQLIGAKPDGSHFSIGVQNPFDDRGEYLMALSADNIAVVSSGDYERYFEYEGEIYHHILSTKTGYPAQTNIKQVTIAAPNSRTADALSTSVLLLGLEDGIKLINSIENVEAVFITKDKKVYITDALRENITYVEEQMSDFIVVSDANDLY